MQMDAGLDTGAMLLTEAHADCAARHHRQPARQAGRAGRRDDRGRRCDKLQQGRLVAIPQPAQGATYAAKISKEEALLDFNQPAAAIARKIRAFNPFPGACAVFNGVTLKLWQAQALPDGTAFPPGQVLAANAQEGVLVACGDGVLRLSVLQKPGGKRLPAAEFLPGFRWKTAASLDSLGVCQKTLLFRADFIAD